MKQRRRRRPLPPPPPPPPPQQQQGQDIRVIEVQRMSGSIVRDPVNRLRRSMIEIHLLIDDSPRWAMDITQINVYYR